MDNHHKKEAKGEAAVQHQKSIWHSTGVNNIKMVG